MDQRAQSSRRKGAEILSSMKTETVAVLDEWFKAHGDDKCLRDKLTVSGLSSALQAKKRAELAKKLTRIVDVRVDTELRIGPKRKDREEESE